MDRMIDRLTSRQLEKLLKARKRQAKVAPLELRRQKLLKSAERLQRRIDRLLAVKPAGRRGRPPKARRGRPPKRGKVGRPARRSRKPGRPPKHARRLSAAARRRIALAVSRAQKKRWAAFRRAKAATMRGRNKPAPQKRKSIRKPQITEPKPRPGTLAAQIEMVAGQKLTTQPRI
jgi:hypothetical protein